MDVVITHVNADFDALGSMVGACRLYPGAVAVLPAGAAPACRDFLSLHKGIFCPLGPAEVRAEAIARLIVVDCASPARLGECAAWLDLPELEVHRYDHHPDAAAGIAAARSRVEARGAASTVVACELRERGLVPTPFEATALLLGIYEDTGAFSHPGANPEDLETAAWLIRCGGSLDVVEEFLHGGLRPAQRALLGELLAGRRLVEVRGVPVVIACAEPGPYVEDTAMLAHRVMEAERVSAAFLVVTMEEAVTVIGRTTGDLLDVGAVMRRLGGGGHRHAGSAVIREREPGEVVALLEQTLREEVIPEQTAGDLMSYPVRTISPDATVLEALRRLRKYGHSGLIVTDRGRVAGVITRRDVDKAARHRLDHAPVRAYMSTEVQTVGPDLGLGAIERLMIAEGIGRVPVLEHGEVVGIVTRTDVLRALHGSRYLEESPAAGPSDVSELLRSRLPAALQRLLESAGATADRLGARVYLVGGPVRDLLLDVRNLDVDLMVEPDGPAFARAWARDVGGEVVRVDAPFGTAKVAFPGTGEVDVATARTESYERPGALPEVEPSSVADDLRRRDFTLNAMAIRLNAEGFGRLLDPFGGRKDLADRRLRVLHNLSFVEDPTRVFRAVRFESRLHFRMDRHTTRLARSGLAAGILDTITPERLQRQLALTIGDHRPVGALMRLEELGALQALHPDLKLDLPLLRAVPGTLAWWRNLGEADELDPFPIYVCALLAALGPDRALALATGRLHVTGPILARVREGLEMPDDGSGLFPAEGEPAQLTRLWKRFYLETLVLAAARGHGRPEAGRARALLRRYLKEWRHLRLAITGDDLKALGYRPGPAMGQALERTLDCRLNGGVLQREQQLAMAREWMDSAAPSDR